MRISDWSSDVCSSDLWGSALAGGFDLVISNPPYVALHEMADLAPEVARYDPRAALVAGPDGLDAYRTISIDLRRLMAPGGRSEERRVGKECVRTCRSRW